MKKEKSILIRGIVILFMLAYHLHDICDSYISWIHISNHPLTYYIHNMTHPVSFYILLSGYGLSYVGQTKVRTKIHKLLKLYVTFWIIIIIFPIIIGGLMYPTKYPGNITDIISNAIGYKWTYNIHNWFLFPYAILYLFSGFILLVINKIGNIKALLLSFFISYLSLFVVSKYHWVYYYQVIYIFLDVLGFLFPFCSGIVMERLNRQDILINKQLSSQRAFVILCAICILRSLFHTHALNPLFAILVVYLLIHINFGKTISHVLKTLGKYSMPMWFIHGYFTVYLFHDYLCLLKYPLFIYIVLVCVSLLLSIPILKIRDYIFKTIQL